MPRLLFPADATASTGPSSSGKSPVARRSRPATTNGKFNASASNGHGRAISRLGKNKNSRYYSARQMLRVLQFIVLPGLFLVMLAAFFRVKTLVVNDTSKASDNQNNLRDVLHQHQDKAADNSNQEITKKVEQANLRASGPIDKLLEDKKVHVDKGEAEAEYLGNYVPLLKPAANHVKPGSVEHWYTERQRPNDKIVYFLHIHKSGGTALCNLARYNHLSTSATNCNVQSDQRCCGNEDSLEAQRSYANRTRYDFVASEGRMYDSMDPGLYAYILVLRKSLNRYYSHWKHVKLTYRLLPPSMRLEDEPELEAAGGAPPQLGHIQAAVVDSQDGDRHDQMMDLVRHSKEKRAAARQQKMAEMEEWKRQAALVGEEAKKYPVQHQQHQQRNVTNDGGPKPTPKPLSMEDLTMKTNKDMYMPHRRLIEHTSNQRRKLTVEDVAEEKSEKGTKRKAPLVPHMRMPHPADGPEHAFSRSDGPPKDYTMPIFGRTFAEWWTRQPDNWNFRQLCGNHCAGIPKYQLTMDDWAYTISRLLQFESVLFIEDFQSSIDVLAARRGWKESSIEALNAFLEKEAVRKAMEREKHSHNGAATGGNTKEFYNSNKKKEAPEDEPRFKKQQLRQWDPLMAALDDALYDIAKRWEALKQQKGTTSLATQELATLVNIFALPQDVQDIFQVYMDEGDHRVQCENECCAERCSAW